MVIIILDEFFIRFSDFLINVFIRLIDYIVLFMNKLGNGRNNENIDSSKDGSNHDYFEDEDESSPEEAEVKAEAEAEEEVKAEAEEEVKTEAAADNKADEETAEAKGE